MALYATLADLIARFREAELVQLTDLDNQGAIVVGTVDKAIADASAVIDAYLAPRYALPLATVPRVLLNICCDLARAQLYEDAITDQVQKRADAAMALLRDIGKGNVSLGVDQAGAAEPVDAGPVVVTGGERVFSRDLLSDYTAKR